MTHLEKLTKMAESTNKKHIILEAFLNVDKDRRWRFVIGGYPADGIGGTPEEAIDAAYKIRFPPIPKKVGSWEWTEALNKWNCSSFINDDYLWVARQPTAHTPVYIFGGSHVQRLHEARLTKQVAKDFLELIEINPKLSPPTE